jgi:hypothetical protein
MSVVVLQFGEWPLSFYFLAVAKGKAGAVVGGHSLHNDKVERAPRWTGQIQAGCGGRLMELGVHADEWSALPPPRNGATPLQREVITHAHAEGAYQHPNNGNPTLIPTPVVLPSSSHGPGGPGPRSGGIRLSV